LDLWGGNLAKVQKFHFVEGLQRRLREIYPNIAELERIALQKGIPISEPFRGTRIGAFHVLAPTRARYLDLIVQSERTPQSAAEAQATSMAAAGKRLYEAVAAVVGLVRSAWGVEVFSDEPVSAENEMSVVQYAYLCGDKLLLTADASRDGLSEAAHFASAVGLVLPGIDRFQVPHHGSRRNVTTALLDHWLGPRLSAKPEKGQERFSAYISSAKADKDHPRKAVVRALIHRGARVLATEGQSIVTRRFAPERDDYGPVESLPYPEEQED
jgi:hypothetical protein